jgi:DNA helicase-2/ATP-dependent DNA helicase PcrA
MLGSGTTINARAERSGLRRSPRARAEAAGGDPPPHHAAGERVFHQKLGYGTVVSSEAGNLVVRFDVSGEKNVKASYVEKT